MANEHRCCMRIAILYASRCHCLIFQVVSPPLPAGQHLWHCCAGMSSFSENVSCHHGAVVVVGDPRITSEITSDASVARLGYSKRFILHCAPASATLPWVQCYSCWVYNFKIPRILNRPSIIDDQTIKVDQTAVRSLSRCGAFTTSIEILAHFTSSPRWCCRKSHSNLTRLSEIHRIWYEYSAS